MMPPNLLARASHPFRGGVDRRRRAAALGLMFVSLLVSACGTRLEHSAIERGNYNAALVDADRSGVLGSSGALGEDGSVGGGTAGLAAAPQATPSGTSANGRSPGAAGATPHGGVSVPAPASRSSGSAGASGQGSAAGSQVANGEPILIGQVGTFSGPAGAAQIGGQHSLAVWVRHTNAHGGLNGHPVKLFSADDGGDPSKAASLVQDMVENKHVVAFVGQFAGLTFSGTKNYVQAHKIPVVGGDNVTTGWYENSMFFPQGSHVNELYYGGIKLNVDRGSKHVGILYCIESPACSYSANYVQSSGARDAGTDVVYSAQVSLGTLNFQSQCQQAKSKGVGIFFVAVDGATIGRIARDCAQIGFKPAYVTSSIAVSDAQKEDPNLEGLTVGSGQFPWVNDSTPAEKAYQQAMATYAPGRDLSGSGAAGWASAQLFGKAVGAIGANKAVTSAAIVEGLYSLGTTTNDGLSPSLTFRRGQPAVPARCYFVVRISGGRWTSPDGSKARCGPQP